MPIKDKECEYEDGPAFTDQYGIVDNKQNKTLKQIILLSSMLSVFTLAASAQDTHEHNETSLTDSIMPFAEQHIAGVEVTQRRSGMRRMKGAINGNIIDKEELFKAACCNLGESFVTNPSVDVNYSDAATGARQIKLLGLSGTYVQMLTENLPNFRGAAGPYALGYVPGPWMKSIQVSKGSSSVRNGYESMTGQINIEYLKPEDEQGVTVNMYGDTEARFEANVDANVHINKHLSSEILAHYENRFVEHDGNGDGFRDMPGIRQYNLQNRWLYNNSKYIFHGGVSLLKEDRFSGQTEHHVHISSNMPRYKIGIETDRYEAYMKHAFVLSREHNSSIALMASGSMHRQDAGYGIRSYYVNEKNAYAQMLFETDITEMHNISLGLSLNYDYLGQRIDKDAHFKDGMTEIVPALFRLNEKETTPGAYAQYTFDLHHKFTAMAGVRVDHSSLYGTFVTPRVHLKWQPNDIIGLRVSAGKGYRTVHPYAEYNYLLASGRDVVVRQLDQEAAWNYGLNASLNIPVGQRTLKVNAEYYYTDFDNQVDIDYDADRTKIIIDNVRGRSYSHTLQIDASYELIKRLTLTAAYRRNIVKGVYGGKLTDKPLTGKYKGLFTASYKTPLGIWQFDATFQLNGGGRMPTPYQKADGTPSWKPTYNAFGQLSAQVTRWFRHFSVYVGGENLTGYRQETPIFGASNPWGRDFEPTLVWGPMSGAMGYVGIRINIGRM